MELGRITHNLFSGAGHKIDELTKTLLKLKDNFDRCVSVQSVVKSAQILDKVTELENHNLLNQLRQASPRQSVREECLPGTRSKIIQEIAQQLLTPSETAQIVWLSGVAGSGKSTIASSISEYFRGLRQLVTGLSFSRNDVTGSEPILILHSIALGLANAHPNIKQAICRADDVNLVHAPLNKQFRELLLGPLVSVKQHLVGPIIIVLDALDECSDDSRNDISNLFRNNPAIGEFDLNIVNDTHEDISVYVHDKLATMKRMNPVFNSGPGKISALVKLSGNLGKKSYGWSTRLENLLKRPEIGGDLDELYTMALQGDADWDTKEFREPATTILATIALAKIPMTDTAIELILGLLQLGSWHILAP
ncbi:hypothetical protein R3P38DRAFT_2806674 [Favolaschia claudopus]|uniref:Nephrocystin 3-like N-terminal domain-containing protein n=1 Tax=Favolaschia claudopus TaxID=2862362 RepID=A0AAV9ZIZ2_9AGAR